MIIEWHVRRLTHGQAAGDDPAALVAAVDWHGWNVLHCLADAPHLATEAVTNSIRLLAMINPSATAACTPDGLTPLHLAARSGNAAAVRPLLEAAPASVAAVDQQGKTPVERMDWARNSRQWASNGYEAACLLLSAPGQEPCRLLRSLHGVPPRPHGVRLMTTLPLFPVVAAHHSLSPSDWSVFPQPWPGLAAVLPAVVERSTAEAALLVAHLPKRCRRSLRTAALCLRRAQAVQRTSLPQPLVWRILAAAMT